MRKIIGVIPARYASTRFPGKPLALILGKTLIQRTYENALQSPLLSHVVVATDDRRIFEHVVAFGGHVVMTPENCATGTDRIGALLRDHRQYDETDIIVNIQGDEPCLEPIVIEKIVAALLSDPSAQMSTAIAKLTSAKEAMSSSVVKCVKDLNDNALYFSRALIPSGKNAPMRPEITYYKHLGIYAYRRDFIERYLKLPPTPLQLAEDLEQLKVLEHGFRIKTAEVESSSIGVDTPEDINHIERLLCRQNTYS